MLIDTVNEIENLTANLGRKIWAGNLDRRVFALADLQARPAGARPFARLTAMRRDR